MAISYNLIMSDRKRYPLTYICFGLLGRFPEISVHNFDEDSDFYKGGAYHESFNPTVEELVSVEYNYKRDIDRRNNPTSPHKIAIEEKYILEVTKFINAFSWVREIAALNRKLGVVRVRARGVPADKTMFVLMTVRNILDEAQSESYGDRALLEKLSFIEECLPDYKQRWIFSNLMSSFIRRDWETGGFQRICSPKFNDESNILNAATFGKKSLRFLLSGEEPEWYQDVFEESDRGYLRDGHMEEMDITFGMIGDPEDVCSDYPDDVVGACGSLLFRTLCDSLSIEGDFECIFEQGEYDDYVGFVYRGQLFLENVIEDFINAVKEIEEE